MQIHSWHILGIATVGVLGVWLIDRVVRRYRIRRFRRHASQFHLRYSPVDRFNLAPRIASSLPDPAAADVRVRDLMYRTHDGHHEYVFTVDYLTGTIGGTQRQTVVGAIREPRGRACDLTGLLQLADPALLWQAQYESLLVDSRNL